MDDTKIRLALAGRERYMHATEILDMATRQYHRSIEELAESGASTREIADLLDMSHQRVHQILGKDDDPVSEAPLPKRGSGSSGAGTFSCTFCGKRAEQVKKLVAGPGVYICDECIDLCNEIIAEETRSDR